MDEDKTDPGTGNASTFSIIGGIFSEKVSRVRDISGYLNELRNPGDRAEAFWRLADALREMLDIGEDLHRIVKLMAAEGQPEVEISVEET